MNVDETVARLEAVFKDLFWECTLPPAQMTRTNVAQWDSLAHLNLVLSIEQEFEVSLSDQDVVDLNSFDLAADILTEKLAAS